jgi:hypothetical protein
MRLLLLVAAMVATLGVRDAEPQGAAPRVEFPWVFQRLASRFARSTLEPSFFGDLRAAVGLA